MGWRGLPDYPSYPEMSERVRDRWVPKITLLCPWVCPEWVSGYWYPDGGRKTSSGMVTITLPGSIGGNLVNSLQGKLRHHHNLTVSYRKRDEPIRYEIRFIG